MDLGIRVENKTLYISLSGELDQHNYSKVKDVIDVCIQKYFYDSVVFNFQNLDFMDSTGIGMLIGRYKFLKRMNKPCFICGANNSIEKILKMTGIYSIMPKIEVMSI